MIAVDDLLAVSFKSGNRTHDRARREDDVLRLNAFFLSVFSRDFDFPRQRQTRRAFEYRDLVFLHQVLNALGILHYDFILALLHIRKGKLNSRCLDAKVSGVLHLFVDMRRHQKLLGRDASAQSTSST